MSHAELIEKHAALKAQAARSGAAPAPKAAPDSSKTA
jgi:hypothetical protein